ncbi:hypothetical protein UlMin_034256 [Ulmus minor]
MTPAGHRLISIPTATFPAISSFPPISKPKLLPEQVRRGLQLRTQFARRDLASLAFIVLVPSISQPAPATAFSIGISGPKDWLKEQKKKASRFLLAPIDASQQSLRTAYLLLTAKDYQYSNKELEEIQKLLRSAARDCIPGERNSFVAFQANTGVEVCTFRLIVKNAASLLGDKDPLKFEAEALLTDVIRSFTSLQALANKTDIQLPSERQSLQDSLTDTIYSLGKFEQGIRDCLDA